MAHKHAVDRLREQDQRNGQAGTPRSRCPDDKYAEDKRGDAWEPPHKPEPQADPEPEILLDEIDAADLAMAADDPELRFVPLLGREGYFVRGWSHVVSGYPRSGKTELLVACCPSWLQASETILYFTEEPRSIWHYRLANSPGPWRGMRLVFGLGVSPLELMARIQRGTESIVVIDTARNLGMLPHDENDNAALARALSPWVATARKKEKTLIIVHHNRKGGGEHGEGIAGGHAFLGAVDVALEISRDKQPNRRIVKSVARLIQPEELLYERDQSGCLIVLGDPGSVGLLEVRRKVVEVVEDDWLKTAEVYDRLDDPKPGMEQVRKALRAEVEAGNLQRDPPLNVKAAGKKVCWRLAQNDLGQSATNLPRPPPEGCDRGRFYRRAARSRLRQLQTEVHS